MPIFFKHSHFSAILSAASAVQSGRFILVHIGPMNLRSSRRLVTVKNPPFGFWGPIRVSKMMFFLLTELAYIELTKSSFQQ